MGEYLIFVMNAVNGVHLNLCVKKFKKNEKITVLGSVYIAAVNVIFQTKCAILQPKVHFSRRGYSVGAEGSTERAI